MEDISMSNEMIVTLELENERKDNEYIEDLKSLIFYSDDENYLEFTLEYCEQIGEHKAEIDIVFPHIDNLKSVINLLHNPYKVTYGCGMDKLDNEIDKSKLSIIKVIELEEFDDVEYNPYTLDKNEE